LEFWGGFFLVFLLDFFRSRGRGRLGVHGLSVLLGTQPFGDIEWRVNGRRGGSVLGGDGAAIRDQAFDGHDHGDGLDLGGHPVAGPFGFQVGDIPETGQDFVAAHVEPTEFLGILLDELLLNGGTVFNDVGADTRLGFDVSSWIVVETCGC
jgi:hypothetical protein